MQSDQLLPDENIPDLVKEANFSFLDLNCFEVSGNVDQEVYCEILLKSSCCDPVIAGFQERSSKFNFFPVSNGIRRKASGTLKFAFSSSLIFEQL